VVTERERENEKEEICRVNEWIEGIEQKGKRENHCDFEF